MIRPGSRPEVMLRHPEYPARKTLAVPKRMPYAIAAPQTRPYLFTSSPGSQSGSLVFAPGFPLQRNGGVSPGDSPLQTLKLKTLEFPTTKTSAHSVRPPPPLSLHSNRPSIMCRVPILSDQLVQIQQGIATCELCPRLRTYCTGIGETKRRAYRTTPTGPGRFPASVTRRPAS